MSGAGVLARIFWIEHAGASGRLAILSRPSPGRMADEVAAWRSAGVGTVVSLLEPDEAADLDLRTLPQCCADAGLDFVSFPVPDRGVPGSSRDATRLARHLASRIEAGGSVGVHCRAGIGRSAVLAACVLGALGVPPDTALDAVAAARGVPVPDTPEQREWVRLVAGRSG